MNPVVNLRSAICVINDFPVLVDAELKVDAGEVVGLRGANGAGKTTLLRVLAGFTHLRSGTCEVFGLDAGRDKRWVRSKVTYVGHTPALYEDLTLVENLEFGAASSASLAGGSGGWLASDKAAGRKVGKPDLRARLDLAFNAVGLQGQVRNIAAKHASAGQRRRVALAMLVARNSPLWLLDEPMSALDVQGQELVRSLVAAAKSEGTTILVSTHDDRLQSLVDREVEIRNGAIKGGLEVGGIVPRPAQRVSEVAAEVDAGFADV